MQARRVVLAQTQNVKDFLVAVVARVAKLFAWGLVLVLFPFTFGQ
jgi:hypothetical protein